MTANQYHGEGRIQRVVLDDQRDEAADGGEGGEQDRQESHLPCLADCLCETHAAGPQEVCEIHEKERVLDLDARERNEADGCREEKLS